ncbi:hypothetical protein ZWY2020_038955 [Hordeum vulgare]|nr:hypothetical protein ZWY2020_038955 [Hordeum vulgare]
MRVRCGSARSSRSLMRPKVPTSVGLFSLFCVWSICRLLLLLCSYVLAVFTPDLFPKTQVAADTAVEVCREEHRAAGQEVDTTSDWSVEEIGVGLRARVHVLGEPVTRLQVAGSSMVAALWPEGVEPTTMSRLAHWLAAGGERLDAGARSWVRAYMALRLAKSWYRNLNLGKLAARRDGSEAELQGMEEELRVRASAVAEYAAWDDFVLERG